MLKPGEIIPNASPHGFFPPLPPSQSVEERMLAELVRIRECLERMETRGKGNKETERDTAQVSVWKDTDVERQVPDTKREDVPAGSTARPPKSKYRTRR